MGFSLSKPDVKSRTGINKLWKSSFQKQKARRQHQNDAVVGKVTSHVVTWQPLGNPDLNAI